MPVINKYRVWCNDESTHIDVWAESEPTLCPNDTNHVIDTNKTTIIFSEGAEHPHDKSGKERVHETSRKLGTITYWTGEGDDDTDITKVGGGTEFSISHTQGGGSISPTYLDFNIIENETHLHEGYIQWLNCDHVNYITVEMVPRVTTTEAGTDTNYNVYGGYLIIPAAGDGTVNVTADLTSPTGGLVYMPDDDDGNAPEAYWNADWNSTTKLFENITAAPSGNGRYNLFSVEVPLARFFNKFPMLGHGFTRLQSADADEMGQGMRIKATWDTNATDHTWSASCVITMHRAKTC